MRIRFLPRPLRLPPMAAASLTVASLIATTAPALAQSNRSIINGGFEQPPVAPEMFVLVDEGQVPGWETSAADGVMELWGTGFLGVPAFEGNQFAELNANLVATLFQPLCLVPGDVVNWSFAHRGRAGVDTIRLAIGADVVTTVATGTDDWSVNSGTYTPTLASSAPVDFFFESVDAAGGSGGAGNFLDAVKIVLPPHYELSTATGSDAEATGGNLPVLLVSGTLTSPGSVTVSVSGTATPGTDYTTTATITIPAGEYDGTVATGIPLGIAILDEDIDEADETITITITNPTGDNDGNPARIADVDCNDTGLNAATYTITNDDDTTCGDGLVEGGEGCDDGNTTAGDGCSGTCTVEDMYECARADFSLVSEEAIDGGENLAPDWELAADGFSVFQGVNSDPGIYLSSLPAQNVGDIEFTIAVETTSDDDFVGVVLGFDTGELTDTDASYLLIDWKQLDQQSGAYLAEAGLAVSLVTGPTTADDLWGHTDTVRELAEATTLATTGWNDNEVYTFTLSYTATRLTLRVNGTTEIDLQAAEVGLDAFPAGNLGFYNYSQTAVRYTLLSPRGRSICVFDPCPGHDDSLDADGDGVPDGCDACTGADDGADADGDGTPDGCDVCADSDDSADADGDGTPDGCDVCAGSDDDADADGDGTADGCDVCAGFDDDADADSDGTPDGCDLCAMDAANDADSDGVCASDDNCPLQANPDQADRNADGVGDACSPRYGLQGGGCSATNGAAGGWNALLVVLAVFLVSGWRRRRALRAS